MRNEENVSLRGKLVVAMIIVTIVSTLVLIVFSYFYSEKFCKEKIDTYQRNQLDMMAASFDKTVIQVRYIYQEVIRLAISSPDFAGYDKMSGLEKLNLKQNIDSRLFSSAVNNAVIDHIYMVNFDGTCYSSNKDVVLSEFMESLPKIIVKEQTSVTMVLTTCPVNYRNQEQPPDYGVVSILTYLSSNIRNGTVGLIRLDIPFSILNENLSLMTMTKNDFALIIDKENTIIFSTVKEQIGQTLEEQQVEGLDMKGLADRLSDRELVREGRYTVRQKDIEGTGWSIIQVNSDAMLKKELRTVRDMCLLTGLVCLAAGGILSFLFSVKIMNPLKSIIKSMEKVSEGDFSIRVKEGKNKDIKILTSGFNRMIGEIDMLMKENIRREHERTVVELSALSVKINLHFLYNTLNSIKWFAIIRKQPEIAELIVSLSSILEYSYKDTDSEVTIGEEIEFIKNYIFIHETRYGGKVEVIYDLEDGVRECRVLKMILQPIVENILLHAFDYGCADNAIEIRARFREQKICFVVRDNGKGFHNEGMEAMTGVGLNNVRQRLLLNYGEGYKLEVNSVIGTGTEICFCIPIH